MFQLQLSSLNCKRSPACTAYASTATTTMDSGYPLDWFTESVDAQLICEICGKVLQSPRATPCGHHFCLHCLEFWIEYYGICPKRCGEIELEGLRKDPQIEKRILALAVHCKYQNSGCNAQIPLAEKQRHEKKCIYKGKAELPNILVENKNSLSQDTYVEMASVECRNKTVEHAPPKTNLHPAPELAYYTYHLTRKAPGESLGFILVAGAKNSNGKAVNFSIKTVNPGTVAAEAGLLPGDKILQVDHIGLSQLTQQEAVSRIKDNPRVILTVLRAHSKRATVNDHIYEDILYSDIPNQENTAHHNTASGGDMASRERTDSTAGRRDQSHLHRKKSDPFPTRIMISTEGLRHKSPTFTTVNSDPPRGFVKSPKLLTEKISADSGLSSSTSSFSPSHNSRERTRYVTDGPATELDRHHSYPIEKPKKYSHETRRGKTTAGEPSPLSHNRKIRIEGDYEVEEIFLQKNGTNQLGITLGYDTKSSSGNLFVCEIISDGLAAKDGRIKRGDIVRKVNGFDVYDPEEAVLLFLEQDQDISLTVARKIKSRHRHRKGMLASKSQCALNSPLLAQDVFDFEGSMRRTDSCGSLDSHNYKYTEEEKTTRRNSESVATKHSTSHPSTSSYSTGLVTPSISTDYIFRPIKEGRPATAGEFHSGSRFRSSTSLGSAPEPTRHPSPQIHQTTATRHQSFDANHPRMPRSTSPTKYPSQNFKMSCHDVLPNRGDMIAPAERLAMYRSVSTFRCESLV